MTTRTSWMVVATGYHDDVRVRKMADSVLGFATIDHVVVLAMNRSGVAPNAARADANPGIEVRLHGRGNRQFQSRIIKLPSRASFLAWAARIIHRESEAHDVIHVHDLDTVPAGLAARKSTQPLVFDVHEVYSGRNGLPPWIQRVLRRMEAATMPRADGLVFVSDAARDHYATRMALPPSVVATNSRPRASVRATDHDMHRPVRLVYVGRLTAGRGLEQVIRMMDLLEDHHLDVIGFGPLTSRLRQVADDLGDAASRVTFRNAVSIDDVVDTVASRDIGVVATEPTCANHRLTVSNKLFEYAAAGLPVLMSDVEEHRRLLDRHPFGVIARDVTPSSLANAVRRLTDDPHQWRIASQAATALATSRAWENEAAAVERLYGNLLTTR